MFEVRCRPLNRPPQEHGQVQEQLNLYQTREEQHNHTIDIRQAKAFENANGNVTGPHRCQLIIYTIENRSMRP